MSKAVKKIYKIICEAEMYVAAICLATSTSVIFASAVMRTVGRPVRWGLDIALLLFTWSTFLGADIAFRNKALVNVDMLVKVLPWPMRRLLDVAVYLLMLGAILFLLYFGLRLTILSSARSFQGTPWLSYSWASASLPVSMALMLISALRQGYRKFIRRDDADDAVEERGTEAW